MLSARRPPARGWGPELASERDERAGEEGSPGARPPPARARPCTLTRTRTLTHARKLTSLPSSPLYFSFLPVPSLARSLSLSLSLSLFSTPPSSPLPPSPRLLLFLASSFISLGLFRSLLSLSPPFSSFPLSPSSVPPPDVYSPSDGASLHSPPPAPPLRAHTHAHTHTPRWN